mmetsp:Transcript_18903/g.33304  ORF Transcript_18903/g.33304 Transcript_18903/m.33304 type:complete len:702 (+) Transcript_18903:96-2201(+)
MLRASVLFLALIQQATSVLVHSEDSVAANPIRKVVTMMQKMQAKLEEEAEKEKELFEKFECYCQKTTATLEEEIAKAEAIGNVKPEDIEAKQAALAAAKQAVEESKKEKIDDEESIKVATARFEKSFKEHEATIAEEKETEGAGEEALKALGAKEMDPDAPPPSFLQQGSKIAGFVPRLLKAIERSSKVAPFEKQQITAFLQGKGKEAPVTSGEVTAYIKDIEDEAETEISEEQHEETDEQESTAQLTKSKKTEITSLLESMERKMKKIGDLEVEIVNMKHMMGDGADAMKENKKMLAEVKKDCELKATEEEERQKMRAEEQLAITDTIKMLNSDDALDIFKKALPSPSLIQMSAGKEQARQKAKAFVNHARSAENRPELNFLALALSNKKVDFSKVFVKIDEMVKLLKKEGADDESKKEYCDKEFEEAADKTKDLSKKIEELAANLAESKDSVAKLEEEIKSINDGVKALDESVTQATENRKAESAEYQELMQSDSAAVDLLGMAKERLNKFYNPDLTTDTTTTTDKYDPYAFLQLSAATEAAVGAPPPTAGAYKAKAQESNGILHMMDTMIQDLDKEMTIAKTEEKNSQEEYEESVADAKAKRAADVKSAGQKSKAKADIEGDINEDASEKDGESKELRAVKEYTLDLHKECDWMLQNFDLRAKAREEEVENLKRSKAVLAGADFSLLQVQAVRRLRGN